jgi:hypothetical protein
MTGSGVIRRLSVEEVADYAALIRSTGYGLYERDDGL